MVGGTDEAAGARVCSLVDSWDLMLSPPAWQSQAWDTVSGFSLYRQASLAADLSSVGGDHHRSVKAGVALSAVTAQLLAAGKGARLCKAFAPHP